MILQPRKVILDPKNHIYYDENDLIYLSVSRFIDSFKSNYFTENKGRLVEMTAAKRRREVEMESVITGRSVSAIVASLPIGSRGITSEEVNKEWHDIRQHANNEGNNIDAIITKYMRTAMVTPGYEKECAFVGSILREYYQYDSQGILYNDMHMIAGTYDMALARTRSRRSIIDFADIKSNAAKFNYDSSIIDKSTFQVKQTNSFYNDPISHLEQSYYNRTTLQLSTYAYMADMAGYRIGKLFVVLLDRDQIIQPQKIYCSYMKKEIEAMLESNPENNG